MYTFRNICVQDKDLELNDGTTKIFLCSEGALNDVTADIKAFLDYIKGMPVNDEFVTEIDSFIKEIKIKEEERVSYMTYAMKIKEAEDYGRAEGRAEGEKNADIRTAKRLLSKNNTIDEILEIVDLSREEVEELAKNLH